MDMKKAAEVVVLGSMFAVSMGANAATSIGATTAAQTKSISVGTYVLEAFTLNISANVGMQYIDTDPQAVAVTTANTKGMHTFGGTSNGGSVKQCEATSVSAPSPSAPAIATGCP